MAQKSVEQEMEVAVDVAALSSRAEKKWNELDVDDSFSASASAEWEKCTPHRSRPQSPCSVICVIISIVYFIFERIFTITCAVSRSTAR